MKLTLIALCLVATHASATTPAIRTATMAATTGRTPSSSPTPAMPTRPAAGLCLWQVPNLQQWINLYAVQSIRITGSGQSYQTVISMDALSYSRVDVLIPPGAETDIHFRSIKQRLTECLEGKP